MSKSQRAVGKLVGKAAEYRITMTDLAEASGVTRVTLSNWRSGRSVPSLEKYLDVKEALDTIVAVKQNVS